MKCSAKVPVLVSAGGDEVEIIALIEYTIIPGRPATGPSYASGGEPAEGAEIEIIEVELEIEDKSKEPPTRTREPCPKWLFDYLTNSSDVYDNLGDHADWGFVGPDPDEAYERMRDEASER